MPAKSQAQFRYMGAVASGRIKSKGLSRDEARKFLHESRGTYGKLPSKVKMKDNNMDDTGEMPVIKKGVGGKFAKDTYAKGKKPPPKKGKKMSRAEFLKMVREKKYGKKKK
jgi:hypothetical protein